MELIRKYWIVIVIAFAVCMYFFPPGCFLILGSIFTFISLKAIQFLNQIQKTGIRTRGEIIRFENNGDGDRYPIVEFTTEDGERIENKPYISSSSYLGPIRFNKRSQNRPVRVLYSQDNPERFVLETSEGHDYFTFVIFLVIGLGFSTSGILEITGVINLF